MAQMAAVTAAEAANEPIPGGYLAMLLQGDDE